MARPVSFEDLDDVAAAATRTGARKPTNGHRDWTITAKFKSAGGAPSKVVTLRGTNDPSDTVGETLVTLTGNADGSFSGSATGKAYKYVFVAVAAGADLVLDEVRVHGSGFEGTA